MRGLLRRQEDGPLIHRGRARNSPSSGARIESFYGTFSCSTGGIEVRCGTSSRAGGPALHLLLTDFAPASLVGRADRAREGVRAGAPHVARCLGRVGRESGDAGGVPHDLQLCPGPRGKATNTFGLAVATGPPGLSPARLLCSVTFNERLFPQMSAVRLFLALSAVVRTFHCRGHGP